ncbi:MAG TPA: hypothetical protein VLH84_02360 [Patescibacteria group bacterium]|nr:hypothetical protein [Patescibacteria group bacterium]
MKTYSQIKQEVGDAVDFVRANGPVDNLDAQDYSFYASLADMPDYTALDGFASQLHEPPTNAVLVSTPYELSLAYKALGSVHGFGIARCRVRADIDHECAHKAGAGPMRYRISLLGLLVCDSSKREYSWQAFHSCADPQKVVTKLALASQIAAPAKPSKGDRLRLAAMGYTGVEDVANRILTAQDPSLARLLLPAGFSRPWRSRLPRLAFAGR